MSDENKQHHVVSGVTATEGSYIELPLVDLSYYPAERLYERVKQTLYGANYMESDRLKQAVEENTAIPCHRPLAHTKVEGKFILFLPSGGRPWGMMEVSKLKPVRKTQQDLTLAVIPALALMPFPLYIDSGQVWEEDGKMFGKFYVVDREGSNWSVHCH